MVRGDLLGEESKGRQPSGKKIPKFLKSAPVMPISELFGGKV
jgi:hypothetical protein